MSSSELSQHSPPIENNIRKKRRMKSGSHDEQTTKTDHVSLGIIKSMSDISCSITSIVHHLSRTILHIVDSDLTDADLSDSADTDIDTAMVTDRQTSKRT